MADEPIQGFDTIVRCINHPDVYLYQIPTMKPEQRLQLLSCALGFIKEIDDLSVVEMTNYLMDLMETLGEHSTMIGAIRDVWGEDPDFAYQLSLLPTRTIDMKILIRKSIEIESELSLIYLLSVDIDTFSSFIHAPIMSKYSNSCLERLYQAIRVNKQSKKKYLTIIEREFGRRRLLRQ